MDSLPPRNCGLGETIANMLLIGCAVLVATAVLAVVLWWCISYCLFNLYELTTTHNKHQGSNNARRYYQNMGE